MNIHEGNLFDDISHAGKPGNELRQNRCPGSSLHTCMQVFHEQDIKKNVDHDGPDQEVEGSTAVAKGAKYGGAEIVQHGCTDAHEDEKNITVGIIEDLFRCVHQAKQIICPEKADSLYEDRNAKPEQDQLCGTLFDNIHSPGTETLCDRNGQAGADTECKAKDQEIQSACHTDTGKGIQAQNTADKDAVGEIIKLLKQIPDQQRETEAQNTLQGRTCCHIFYHEIVSFPIPKN